MRLNPEIAGYLKQLIQEKIPGSTIYLFGSRVDDSALGRRHYQSEYFQTDLILARMGHVPE
jgi:hypothetical protein